MLDQETADFFIDRALEIFGDDFTDAQLDELIQGQWEGLEAMACTSLDAACLGG